MIDIDLLDYSHISYINCILLCATWILRSVFISSRFVLYCLLFSQMHFFFNRYPIILQYLPSMLATAKMVFALVVAFWPNQNSMVSNGGVVWLVVWFFFFGCTLTEEYKSSANEFCHVDERRLLEESGFWLLYYTCLTKFLLLVFRILISTLQYFNF